MASRELANRTWGCIVPPVMLVAAVAVAWAWPKSCPLSLSPSFTGYYRGFGLGGVPLLGKVFYRATFPTTSPDDGLTEVSFSARGWNPFRGTYPDGTLREEGVCWVDINGGANDPAPNIHQVQWGKYYDPSGKMVSEIKDGTGIQTYFTRKGVKTWELELKDGERVHLSWWHDTGTLFHTETYAADKVHSESASYYPSGKLERAGSCYLGRPTGTWTEYNEDGSVKSVEHYGAAPAAAR
jgi:hypothetical protein